MKFQGIIFDLDGTLIFTLEDIADSMNRILSDKEFPVHSYEDYKKFVGHGIRNLVSISLPEDQRKKDLIEEMYGLMLSDYSHNCLVKTHIYDGIEEVTDKLSNEKVRMAILSNKAQKLTEKIAYTLFGNKKFNPVFGANPSFPLKPDPKGALHICQQWGINPSDIAYIGDSDVDMITANKAGMYAVGVLWGYRNKNDLLNGGAKVFVKDPLDLLKVLSI